MLGSRFTRRVTPGPPPVFAADVIHSMLVATFSAWILLVEIVC
jgi:hypothetical protein